MSFEAVPKKGKKVSAVQDAMKKKQEYMVEVAAAQTVVAQAKSQKGQWSDTPIEIVRELETKLSTVQTELDTCDFAGKFVTATDMKTLRATFASESQFLGHLEKFSKTFGPIVKAVADERSRVNQIVAIRNPKAASK